MIEIFFVTCLLVLGSIIFLYSRSFYDEPLTPTKIKDNQRPKKSKSTDDDHKHRRSKSSDDVKSYPKAFGKTIPSLGMEADCVHLRTIEVKTTTPPQQAVNSQIKRKAKVKIAQAEEPEPVQLNPIDFTSEMQRRAREMNLFYETKHTVTPKKDKQPVGKFSGAAIKVNKDLIAKSYSWTTS